MFSCYHKMYAILLIFVVSFNLVSSDVANVQQLLERVDLLELKLASLSNAYELLLKDRNVQNQCNCSYLEEDIRDIGIIAAKNRHNILVNGDMIQKNKEKIEDNFALNSGLIQTNKEKTEANLNSIYVNHNFSNSIHGKPCDFNINYFSGAWYFSSNK